MGLLFAIGAIAAIALLSKSSSGASSKPSSNSSSSIRLKAPSGLNWTAIPYVVAPGRAFVGDVNAASNDIGSDAIVLFSAEIQKGSGVLLIGVAGSVLHFDPMSRTGLRIGLQFIAKKNDAAEKLSSDDLPVIDPKLTAIEVPSNNYAFTSI